MTTQIEAGSAPGRTITAAPLSNTDQFVSTVARICGDALTAEGISGLRGRNDNFVVTAVSGRQYFVKVVKGSPAAVEARLNRALAFETLIAHHPTAALGSVPFHGCDRDQHLMVFDHIADSETSSDRLIDDRLSTADARAMGRALAALHMIPADAPDGPTDLPPAAPEPMAANPFYALTVDAFAQCSGAEAEAWAMLQHDQLLVDAIAALRDSSQDAPAVPTHGDIRLDQFLLAADQMYCIDWEEFRFGDAARDVGALVGEFLHDATRRMFAHIDVASDLAPGEKHSALVAGGEGHLATARELIEQVWSAYQESAQVDAAFARRATAYAGWHFFDRLIAGAMFGAKLSAAERGMAGVGRNALIDPERFAPVIGLSISNEEK